MFNKVVMADGNYTRRYQQKVNLDLLHNLHNFKWMIKSKLGAGALAAVGELYL